MTIVFLKHTNDILTCGDKLKGVACFESRRQELSRIVMFHDYILEYNNLLP